MGQPSSFERDFERLRRLSADLLKAIDAAEASFLDHAKSDANFAAVNFPLEEGVFEETQKVLADWKSQAARLIDNLDTAGSHDRLSFERLFDRDAGLNGAGLIQRSMPRRNASAEEIVSNLTSRLSVLSGLDTMMRGAKAVLVRHHRQCEFHLLQIVERRQEADLAVGEASREIMDLKARLRAHMAGSASERSAAAFTASQEERREIAEALQDAGSKEARFLSERETLVRLVGDVAAVVDALNVDAAAANVMAAKLATDIEQDVSLLKAIVELAAIPMAGVSATISEVIAAFEANPLAGLGLGERKRRADDAFRRRLSPAAPKVEAPASGSEAAEETEAGGEKSAENP